MITEISFFISKDFDEDEIRVLVGKFCDLIDEEGLGNELDQGVLSIGVVRNFDVLEVEQPAFLEDMLADAEFAVLPVSTQTNEGEYDGS